MQKRRNIAYTTRQASVKINVILMIQNKGHNVIRVRMLCNVCLNTSTSIECRYYVKGEGKI